MFSFVANLKPYTFQRKAPKALFSTYLLSVTYAREFSKLATEAVANGRVLVADNGNFGRIQAVIEVHRARAEELDEARKLEEKKLKRCARPGDLSPALRNRYRDLARDIRAQSVSAITPKLTREVLAEQLKLRPHYLVAMEDFTLSSLVSLSIEREYTGLAMTWYERSWRREVELATDTKRGKYGRCDALVFGGLHAVDYDTALRAGRLAGEARLDGIAAGACAGLDDHNFTDYRFVNGRLVELGKLVPRPYVRVLEIAAGLTVGYTEEAGHRPRMHVLGAGSPILLPLLGLLGDAKSFTATDSTAPIQDGWKSFIICVYVDEPAPLKLKTHVIAERWLSDDIAWSCPCPFCIAFNKRFPPDLKKARAWWRSESRRQLGPEDVRTPSPLAELLPWLSMGREELTRSAAGLARVQHNHWVIQRIEAKIRRNSETPSRFRDWVEAQVEAYIKAGSQTSWKQAVRVAFQIASEAASKIERAPPSGPVLETR